MHISDRQQSPNTILTQCSKMTEEGHSRRHAMNGSADGVPKEESPKANYVQGGRLKFFKDGKFILELERAREGERVSWVSVPRKTFWSPQGTAASTPTYRQESSTSLSVSDDNSSIQSSPWQRDHGWKQATPRRNLSRELIFYYCRGPGGRRGRRGLARSAKRRRPYSTAVDVVSPSTASAAPAAAARRDTVCNNVVVKRARYAATAATGAAGATPGAPRRPSLQAVVEALLGRQRAAATATPPRGCELVSPRKRFLREMERDRAAPAEDGGGQKRSRSKAARPAAGNGGGGGGGNGTTVTAPAAASPVRVNGTACTAVVAAAVTATATTAPTTAEEPRPAKNCSYSITSLLADDRSSARRSPSSSPSHYAAPMAQQPPPQQPQQQQQQPQYCTPNDERWYSDSVDKMRSMDLSQAEKRGYSGYHYQSLPPYPPYLHQYPLSPYYGPGLYGRGYMMPPVYHTPHLQTPIRHNVPTCSWTADPSSKDADHRDDNMTDMPLNLSKHAG